MEKCPRCELNYKRDEDKYCKICTKELMGKEETNAFDMCIICGVNTAMEGENVCETCMQKALDDNDKEQDTNYDENNIDGFTDLMDEEIPECDEEIDEEIDEEYDDEYDENDEE